MLSRLRSHLPLWRRALRRRRRLLAVLAAAALIAAVAPGLLPPSARGVEIVVAGAPIPAGTVLSAKDLSIARVAPSLVPEGAPRTIDEVIGRSARLALEPGTPLLTGTLEDEGGVHIPDGSVLMVVPVPAALAPHLGPGSEVLLLPLDPTAAPGAEITARVVEIVAPEGGAPALGGTTGSTEALVVVEESRSREVAHGVAAGGFLVSVIGS